MALITLFVCCGLMALVLDPAIAECPDYHHIGVKWNRTHYMGAYRYDSSSSQNPVQSCKGTALKRYEGYEATATNGTQFVEHAWVVRPGCVVYEYSDYNYQGTETQYAAGVHPQVAKGSKSYKVRCTIAHFQCTPIDKFEAIVTCDNTNAVESNDCKYTKTIGTKLSDSLSHSVSLDVSLEAAISASFFDMFRASLKLSNNTGYDWRSVSTNTKSSMESFEVTAKAPAGYKLKIEQAIGRCGDSLVKTELFRISHYGKRPNFDLKLMKSFKNTSDRVMNPELTPNKHRRGKLL